MENAISTFYKSLATFCHHVQSSSKALSESIQRRPIPLDSAAAAFLQSLDRRISSTSSDLNLLESMAFGTVSFEELLGHCNEVYKKNAEYIADLEDRMKNFGYVPEVELDAGDDEYFSVDSRFMSPNHGLTRPAFGCGSVSAARSSRKGLDDDSLFENSVSLQNLGLSDACLATLASEDNDYSANPTICSGNAKRLSPADVQPHEKAAIFQPWKDVLDASVGGATRNMIQTSKDDYDNLPAYMKSLASWEELQEAVVKMNRYLCENHGTMGSDELNQDDLETLGLGRKGRSYLLLLLRMNQLVVETVDGSIIYRVSC